MFLWQVTITRMHGHMFINGMQITRTDVRTMKGIVHGFADSLLRPSKSRCDIKLNRMINTPCLPCSLNFPCPDESPSSMVNSLFFVLNTTLPELGICLNPLLSPYKDLLLDNNIIGFASIYFSYFLGCGVLYPSFTKVGSLLGTNLIFKVL